MRGLSEKGKSRRIVGQLRTKNDELNTAKQVVYKQIYQKISFIFDRQFKSRFSSSIKQQNEGNLIWFILCSFFIQTIQQLVSQQSKSIKFNLFENQNTKENHITGMISKSLIAKINPQIKPKINQKQTQTRSTLNSGRSSNNNKRCSQQITQTEFKKNNILNLNSSSQPYYIISHKLIHDENQPNKNITQYRENQQSKKKKTKQNLIPLNGPKQIKRPENSLENTEFHKFHSHRESKILFNKNKPYKHQVNSAEKQNICPNVSFSLNQNSRMHKIDGGNDFSSKVQFILPKNTKQKGNLLKKKLILPNQCLPKQKIKLQNSKGKRSKMDLTIKKSSDQIRSTSKSIKQEKKPMGNGRNHSAKKKKDNSLVYSRTKNINKTEQARKKTNKFQQETNKFLVETKAKVVNPYLKLSSPNLLLNNSPQQSQKTYSIKSLIKNLVGKNVIENQSHQQQSHLKKIIDCLTTNDNEQQGHDIQKSNSRSNTQDINNDHFQIPQTEWYHHLMPKTTPSAKQAVSKTARKTPQKQKVLLVNAFQIFEQYEAKILNLYQSLIEQKERRYKLESIIQRYIFWKQNYPPSCQLFFNSKIEFKDKC